MACDRQESNNTRSGNHPPLPDEYAQSHLWEYTRPVGNGIGAALQRLCPLVDFNHNILDNATFIQLIVVRSLDYPRIES